MSSKTIPQHIAIVMDGNGRWAEAQGKPRSYGHTKGAECVMDIVKACYRKQVSTLSLFAFGLENWCRPENEVNGLISLFMLQLQQQTKALHQNNIKLQFIGDRSRFPLGLQERIAESEAITANNTGLILNIAASYSGQWDICEAAKKLRHQTEEITPAYFQEALSTSSLPMVDLFIRTGGEQRISNFMLWQIAYAELYFTDVYWPDYTVNELEKALDWYAGRERRFGAIPQQLKEGV